jgi:uncharacterized protein (DUF2267 family)
MTGERMEYEKFINAVRRCDFIRDGDTAAAAIRVVLEMVASRLEEEDARRLTASLPESLTQRLPERREVRPKIPLSQVIREIGEHFKFSDLQAGLLILTVLHKAETLVEDTRLKTCLNRLSSEIDNILNPTPSGG